MKGKKKPADSSDVSVAGVDLSQLERLLAFMSQHGLEEFEYSQGDLRIRLKKPAANSNPLSQRPMIPPEIVVAGAPPSPPPAAPEAAPPPPVPPPPPPAQGGPRVKSPLVCPLFYTPRPRAGPPGH